MCVTLADSIWEFYLKSELKNTNQFEQTVRQEITFIRCRLN